MEKDNIIECPYIGEDGGCDDCILNYEAWFCLEEA